MGRPGSGRSGLEEDHGREGQGARGTEGPARASGQRWVGSGTVVEHEVLGSFAETPTVRRAAAPGLSPEGPGEDRYGAVRSGRDAQWSGYETVARFVRPAPSLPVTTKRIFPTPPVPLRVIVTR